MSSNDINLLSIKTNIENLYKFRDEYYLLVSNDKYREKSTIIEQRIAVNLKINLLELLIKKLILFFLFIN